MAIISEEKQEYRRKIGSAYDLYKRLQEYEREAETARHELIIAQANITHIQSFLTEDIPRLNAIAADAHHTAHMLNQAHETLLRRGHGREYNSIFGYAPYNFKKDFTYEDSYTFSSPREHIQELLGEDIGDRVKGWYKVHKNSVTTKHYKPGCAITASLILTSVAAPLAYGLASVVDASPTLANTFTTIAAGTAFILGQYLSFQTYRIPFQATAVMLRSKSEEISDYVKKIQGPITIGPSETEHE